MTRRHSLAATVAAIQLVLAGAVLSDAADPTPLGPEIVVSASTDGYRPRIASDASGGFMVVWRDHLSGTGQVARARRFHANGNQFLPEFTWTPPGHGMTSGGSSSSGDFSVGGDAAGNFMLTWTTDDSPPGVTPCLDQCVFTRRNDPDGDTGTPFLIQDSGTTYVYSYFYGDQVSNPEIFDAPNGDFVVMWEGYDKYPYPDGSEGFGSDESAFARKTVSSGQKKGSYFRVNDGAAYYQGQYGEFDGDTDAEGNFVIVFNDEYNEYLTGEPGDLRAQHFTANAKKVGPEFTIATTSYTDGYNIGVAMVDDGTFMVVWQDGDILGRIWGGDGSPVTSDFVVAAGSSAWRPRITTAADSFVVVWQQGDVFAQRFSVAGAELSTELTVATSASRPDVAAAANGDFIVAYDASDGYVKAQRFQLEAPTANDIGVFGKVLVINNKVPDDPTKNKVKWAASGPEIEVPLRGTTDDPRCNGDPSGTVKSTVRFFSPTSGHDSGTISLPCQNWEAFGTNKPAQIAKRGYKYKDPQLVDGPCNAVTVKGTKSLKVKCKGTGFPYDLEEGTSEATVHAILTLGLNAYCSSFPPDSADGSDGKKFKGKNAPIAACPP